MNEDIAVWVFRGSLLLAIPFFLMAGYHFLNMLGNAKSKKHKTILNLVAPIFFLFPNLLSEKGKYHWKRFCIFLIIFGIIFFIVNYSSSYLPENYGE